MGDRMLAVRAARRLLRRLALLSIALTASAVPTATRAQGFDVQQFKPVPNQQDNHFTQHGVRVLDPGRWELGLSANYANDPLVIIDSNDDRVGSLVGDQLTADLLLTVGVVERLELGLDLPLVLMQDGQGVPAATPVDPSGAGFGIGDVHLVGKFLLFDQDSREDPGGFGLSFVLDAQLPTGDEASLQGEGLRMEPRLVLGFALPKSLRLDLQAGYLVRPKTRLLDGDVNDALTLGLGADLPLDAEQVWHLLGETSADVSVLSDEWGAQQLPLELLMGARFFHHASGLMAQLGAGLGLNVGIGTPDYRLILGVSYRPPHDPDPDHDGLLEGEDLCSDDPEDADDFDDEDGCPDPDNDQDRILDRADGCPNQPEDEDGFEDADGCPDADNDRDGILDAADACADDPEDKDGFEDADGCPDADNDEDGILDAADACADDPEDKDGFEDGDGCPDPDNDEDGVLDAQDDCPLEPGQADSKGCPKKIRLEAGRIMILDRVEFAPNQDVILERSGPLLEEVRATLAANPQLKRIRIEGHTDDRGKDSANLDLSRRRAESVARYLVEHGLTAERFESYGCGETHPVDTNKSREGRQQNRRVEFHIIDPAPAEAVRSSEGCVQAATP